MKLMGMVLLAVSTALAQTSESRMPVTDAEKVADALRAAPAFITKDATLLDWPTTPGGEYRVLRKGSSQWTCLPGLPGSPHDEPGCFDQVFLQFIKDSIAGRTPKAQKHRHFIYVWWILGAQQVACDGERQRIPRWATHHDHRAGSKGVADIEPGRIEW